MKRTIVISAVNIRRGGTLRILRDCLSYLSKMPDRNSYRIVALVHRRELADFEGIEYVEMPDIINGWSKRLWCEYVTMNKISKRLAPVYLWFSLHDTTPRVECERQATYFQTSFPFMKLRFQDIKFDYKIFLFGMFTRFAYRVNIKANRHIIVQAEWLRQNFTRMFNLPVNKFIVAPPEEPSCSFSHLESRHDKYIFSYLCGPDCHKNIETICRAAEILEKRPGVKAFSVNLSITGNENKYARWLYSKWNNLDSINFMGYLNKEELRQCYLMTDCLLFPSRIETWGLPISEFKAYHKPMLLANLPYAREASAGSDKVSFFDVDNPRELAARMESLIAGDTSFLQSSSPAIPAEPYAPSWEKIFSILLN